MSIRTASAMAESEASLSSYRSRQNNGSNTSGANNGANSNTNRSKYFMTFATCFTYLAYSLMWFISVSSQHELSRNTSSSLKTIQVGYIVQSICYCVGGIAFGYLYDRFDRQIGLTISLNACACLTIVMPFVTNLTCFMIVQIFRGFLMSGLEICCITLILEMWGPQANSFLQVQQFTFTIGQLVTPFIVQPFLPSESFDHEINNMTASGKIMGSSKLEYETPLSESCYKVLNDLQSKYRNTDPANGIIVPYCITGIIAATAAAFVILFPMPKAKYQRISSENNLYIISIDNLTCETTPMNVRGKKSLAKRKKNIYKIVAVIVGFTMISCYCGVKDMESYFLPKLVNDVVVVNVRQEFIDQSGDLMLQILRGMTAISNATAILVSMYISAKKLLFFNIIMIAASNLMIVMFAKISLIMTWLSIIIMGIGFGSMFASLFAFLSEKIVMSNTITGILLLATKLPVIINWIAFDPDYNINAMIFVYLNIFSITICGSCFAVLCLNNTWLSTRVPQKQNA